MEGAGLSSGASSAASGDRIAPTPAAAPRAPVPDFATLDRSIRAAQARATGGLSPMVLAAPWADWAFHLARAPGKQWALALRLQWLAARYTLWALRAAGDPK